MYNNCFGTVLTPNTNVNTVHGHEYYMKKDMMIVQLYLVKLLLQICNIACNEK